MNFFSLTGQKEVLLLILGTEGFSIASPRLSDVVALLSDLNNLDKSGSTTVPQLLVPWSPAVTAAFRGSEPPYLPVELSYHLQGKPFLGVSTSFVLRNQWPALQESSSTQPSDSLCRWL